MQQVIKRASLPKINNKRVSTEGSTYKPIKYQRFSFELQQKPNQYLKNYNKRIREKRKMVSLFYQNHFSNKVPQTDKAKIKYKDREVREKQEKSMTVQFKSLKRTNTQQNNQITSSQNKFTFNNVLLDDVENFYMKEIRSNQFQENTLTLFIQLLQDNNNILKKVSPIVLESLLKLGFITRYKAGDLIYNQGSPICNIGIMLWGEAILKKQSSKFRFSCYPGYGIGEQILFQDITHTQTRSSKIEKGKFLTYEKCKSVSSCGILFIGEKQYSWMSEELTLQGLKQFVSKFQSLLLRSYLKKREKRLFFG